MANTNNMSKSQGKLIGLSETFNKHDYESEGDKATLFSLSTHLARCSDLIEGSEQPHWTSSFESLNQFGSDHSKSSFRREDLSMCQDQIEEDKDDDLERDLDMDVEDSVPRIDIKPILRKRTSNLNYDDDDDLERASNDDSIFRGWAEEDTIEIRKSDRLCRPKRLSKMKKMRSAIYCNTDNSINLCSVFEKTDSGLPLFDKTNIFERIRGSPLARKSMKIKRRSIRKEMRYEGVGSLKFGDPFNKLKEMADKENNNPFINKPISNADLVDEKLYQPIDFDTPYINQLELIDKYERKDPAMNAISWHTVSGNNKVLGSN